MLITCIGGDKGDIKQVLFHLWNAQSCSFCLLSTVSFPRWRPVMSEPSLQERSRGTGERLVRHGSPLPCQDHLCYSGIYHHGFNSSFLLNFQARQISTNWTHFKWIYQLELYFSLLFFTNKQYTDDFYLFNPNTPDNLFKISHCNT